MHEYKFYSKNDDTKESISKKRFGFDSQRMAEWFFAQIKDLTISQFLELYVVERI